MIARALKLAQKVGVREAAEALQREGHEISWRSIYNWQRGNTPKAKGQRAQPLSPGLAKTEAPPPAEPPPAPVVAERPPEGLSARQLRRWHIERQIENVRQALAVVEGQIARGDTSALSRVGSLNDQLRKWLDALAQLEGPEVEDPDEERRRWQAAADRVLDRIRTGLAALTKAAT